MPSELWPVKWPTSFDTASSTAESIELAEHFAAAIMRFLTLERVGGKTVTIRPGYKWCQSRARSGPFRYDFTLDSDYYLCVCSTGCGCDIEPYIELALPVGRVDEVRINDVVVDPSTYRVVDGKYLVMDDGNGFATCGAIEVTYLNGYPVDLMGQYAAGALAMEYLRAIDGDKKCRLPSGITSITRQGISMEMTTGLFPDGLTGITEVDAFVNLWNPNGLKIRPKVYSPDTARNRQTTWGA